MRGGKRVRLGTNCMSEPRLDGAEDELLQTTVTPDVGKLHAEFERAGGYVNYQWRANKADKARYTRWEIGRAHV